MIRGDGLECLISAEKNGFVKEKNVFSDFALEKLQKCDTVLAV